MLGDGFMRRLSRLGAVIVGLMLVSSAGFAAQATDVTASLEWRLVGPFRAGWATAAAGAGQGSDTFYFGGAGSDVWKSDDAGRT